MVYTMMVIEEIRVFRGNSMTITGIYYDGAMIQVLWR